MNTVSVKKANIIQVVEIQITLQDGHHLVNYNKIHEKLQAFVSFDKQGFGESRFGWMHCKYIDCWLLVMAKKLELV